MAFHWIHVFFPLLRLYNERFNVPKMYTAVHNTNAYVFISYLYMLHTGMSAYKYSLNYSILSPNLRRWNKIRNNFLQRKYTRSWVGEEVKKDKLKNTMEKDREKKNWWENFPFCSCNKYVKKPFLIFFHIFFLFSYFKINV